MRYNSLKKNNKYGKGDSIALSYSLFGKRENKYSNIVFFPLNKEGLKFPFDKFFRENNFYS